MIHCQYEKNGWQNRCEVNGNKWTLPVWSGNKEIKEKHYVNGLSLANTNIHIINSIAMILGIDTGKIRLDFPTQKKGTERIVELCKKYKADEYLTNPDATEKYLDEKELNNAGIELVKHEFEHNIHVFEAFDKHGIDGTIKLLNKGRVKK